MDRSIAIVAMTAILTGGVIVVSLIATIGRAWQRRSSKAAGGLAFEQIDARLERIELAVDSMAVEMERLSEGQRFTTKLLSERRPEPVPAQRL